MKIEFLGTGGAITIPRPGCRCRVCRQAREKGIPYARSGPSVFVHGPDILIDTPEEIKDQLNRSQVGDIAACFYSHWHPDHVMGRRVWEMNRDWIGWPPRNTSTDIFLPRRVAEDFRETLGSWEHLRFLEQQGLVRLIEVAEGEAAAVGAYRVRPMPLAEAYVFGFLIEGDGKRVFIAPDELYGWTPPGELAGVDLAVIPMGISEFDVITGERRIASEHPVLKAEATFEQTLDIVRKLGARRVVMTHIEEPDGLSHDDLQSLAERLNREDLNLSFAYDTWILNVE